jgi:hypothetical protein
MYTRFSSRAIQSKDCYGDAFICLFLNFKYTGSKGVYVGNTHVPKIKIFLN